MPGDPIEGQILLLAAAKASVSPAQLPDLVDRVQAHLGPRRERYRREYERAFADDEREVFFVESGYWEGLGEVLGLGRRERDAVRRAHTEQLRRIGNREDRAAEFDSALEIREPVVIGRR
jgi:hypothetical protein